MYIRQHRTFGPWFAQVERQPSWVVKLALAATVLVIVVPLALLTLAAVFVGLAVFILAGFIVSGGRVLSDLFSGRGRGGGTTVHVDDGRRNVRILRR